MKIEMELPDWVEGKHIYIMAGIELVAYKYLNQPWKMKSSRCSMCGKCCEKNGCKYLINDGDKKICSLGSGRPFSCSVGITDLDNCTEKYDTLL